MKLRAIIAIFQVVFSISPQRAGFETADEREEVVYVPRTTGVDHASSKQKRS
jgi:hypothetical protein